MPIFPSKPNSPAKLAPGSGRNREDVAQVVLARVGVAVDVDDLEGEIGRVARSVARIDQGLAVDHVDLQRPEAQFHIQTLGDARRELRPDPGLVGVDVDARRADGLAFVQDLARDIAHDRAAVGLETQRAPEVGSAELLDAELDLARGVLGRDREGDRVIAVGLREVGGPKAEVAARPRPSLTSCESGMSSSGAAVSEITARSIPICENSALTDAAKLRRIGRHDPARLGIVEINRGRARR